MQCPMFIQCGNTNIQCNSKINTSGLVHVCGQECVLCWLSRQLHWVGTKSRHVYEVGTPKDQHDHTDGLILKQCIYT